MCSTPSPEIIVNKQFELREQWGPLGESVIDSRIDLYINLILVRFH